MSKRELRSGGSTTVQTLDKTKEYKLNSSGALVESTGTPGGTEIVFSGSKSSLRRLADLERNVSILAAKALSDDGTGSGETGDVSYAQKAGKWSSARTITLGGDLSGSVSIDGSANVTLNATVAGNTVALGTDTTGNYMVNVTAGTGISVSHTQGEGSTATVSLNATTDNVSEGSTNLYFTNARARGAVSFTAGSGAYNSTTGVITIPTNTNQLTNGAGFITGYTETDTLDTVLARGATSARAVSHGALTVSGAITATGEITAYYSDKRLKTNIKPIENALAKTLSLHGVTYNANEVAATFGYTNTEQQVGLLAQDVQAVLPQVIAPAPFDIKVVDGKEVSKSGEDYITVKYEKIVALLVEAIKELNDKVEGLEAQLGGSKSL